MLAVRVMSWDSDRTDQLFTFQELDPGQAVKAIAAQVAGDSLDRIGTGPVAKHQNRPVKSGADSLASFGSMARIRAVAVCVAAEGRNQFQRVAEHIQVLALFARSLPSTTFPSVVLPCLCFQ